MSKSMARVILIACILAVAGIEYHHWLRWGWHLVRHQIQVFRRMQPIDEAISSGQFTREQSDKLELIIKAREFARRMYDLPRSRSFTTFVRLDRDLLGENLTAVKSDAFVIRKFSVLGWGNFTYLGFFDPELARIWKSRFEREGYDVVLSGIGAYSTLGILDDPVYSTFLQRSRVSLAGLVFHEMAHEVLYFAGDTAFSENLATAVELPMLKKFMPLETEEAIASSGKRLQDGRQVLEELLALQQRLQEIYTTTEEREDRLRKKSIAIAASEARLRSLGDNDLAAYYLRQGINNATLMGLHRYDVISPSFDKLLGDCNQDVQCYFRELSVFRGCPDFKSVWSQRYFYPVRCSEN